MKKKILSACIVFLIMAVFVLIPAPASRLYIRVWFDEIQGDNCVLYYSVDGDAFSRHVISRIDYDRKMAEFVLEPSLEGRVTDLRLDFPDTEQLICIKNISVSNDGMIQREFNPCDFFDEDNLAYSNAIDAISLVRVRDRAYIRTLSNDPYVVFSPELCGQVMSCYRHFLPTKLAICAFFLGCIVFAKLKIFREDGERNIEEDGGANVSVFCGTRPD